MGPTKNILFSICEKFDNNDTIVKSSFRLDIPCTDLASQLSQRCNEKLYWSFNTLRYEVTASNFPSLFEEWLRLDTEQVKLVYSVTRPPTATAPQVELSPQQGQVASQFTPSSPSSIPSYDRLDERAVPNLQIISSYLLENSKDFVKGFNFATLDPNCVVLDVVNTDKFKNECINQCFSQDFSYCCDENSNVAKHLSYAKYKASTTFSIGSFVSVGASVGYSNENSTFEANKKFCCVVKYSCKQVVIKIPSHLICRDVNCINSGDNCRHLNCVFRLSKSFLQDSQAFIRNCQNNPSQLKNILNTFYNQYGDSFASTVHYGSCAEKTITVTSRIKTDSNTVSHAVGLNANFASVSVSAERESKDVKVNDNITATDNQHWIAHGGGHFDHKSLESIRSNLIQNWVVIKREDSDSLFSLFPQSMRQDVFKIFSQLHFHSDDHVRCSNCVICQEINGMTRNYDEKYKTNEWNSLVSDLSSKTSLIENLGKKYQWVVGLNCWYFGEMMNGKYHGHGKLYKDNKIFMGEWSNGELHGHGKLTVNSITFEGEFHNGLKNGYFKKVIKDTRNHSSSEEYTHFLNNNEYAAELS